MKKTLLASTMLVAAGGMASAEVLFDGFGRFGLYYEENDGSANNEARIEQRFRLNIVGDAVSDGGVEFGARMRIESNENASGEGTSTEARAPEFNVQAGGFRLDVGNTSDVLDSADVVDYFGYGVGLTSSLEQSTGFNLPVSGISGDDEVSPTVKARYMIGDFTVAASYTDDARRDSGDEWQIGAGYTFGDYAIGAAVGSEDDGTDDNDFYAASFGGTVGGIGFSLLIADSDDQDDLSYGGSIVIPVGASTDVRAIFAESGDDDADTAYGIGFRHSLGGGVSLRGGIGEDKDDHMIADLGVIFDF